MFFEQRMTRSLPVLLLLIICSFSLLAQEKVITGKITDLENAAPLEGVSVTLKGTSKSVITDSKGTFSIAVPSEGSTLVFSYVGFGQKEIKAGNSASLNVTLAKLDNQLDEIIMVGYGGKKKGLLANAVEPINMKAIQDLPVGSLSAALRGQLPGVSVAGGQSRPGESGLITIRYPTILSKDGGTLEPIYIVDDVIKTTAEFNILDVSEIESISVLKDAAAAIYGVNGNQGAVYVKTKRGQIGAPKVSYAGSVGVTDAVRLSEMMNGVELATYLNDYNIARGQPTIPDIYTQDELDYFKAHNYDWLDMAWKTSLVNRQTFNVSGGTEKATYFASVSYNAQDANLKNINSDRWTYRASTDIKLATGLKTGLALSGDLSNTKMYWLKQGGESIEKDVLALLQTPQFNPPYINGLPVLLTSATNATTENFHFFEVQNSDNYTKSKNSGMAVNAYLDWEVPFLTGLKARVSYNRRTDNSFGKQYGTAYPVYRFSMLGTNKHIYGGDVLNSVVLKNGSMLRFNPTTSNNYQLNGSLSYANNFGKHSVTALAMVEQREEYTDGVATYIEDPITGGTDNMNYFTGATVLQSESESEKGYLSYIGRLTYAFANKYIADVTVRADASSNFAPENRWGVFSSFSAAWVISEENFFKDNVSFLDYLKLRAALGFTGADRTRPFQWYDKYKKQTGKGAVFGGDADRTLVLTQDGLTNRNVKWDNTTKYGVGLEARMLKSKLSVTLDGFYDHSYNMLIQLNSAVSLLTGEQLPSENYGIVNSFGTEISLKWNDYIGKNWKYTINSFFSWSDAKNVRVDVAKGLIGSPLDPNGKSRNTGVWGYKYAGMFRSQEEVDAYLAKNPGYTLFGAAPKPGMLYYEDISGPRVDGKATAPDGKITADDDVEYLSKRSSNCYGVGFNFNISYKSLSLGVTSGISWGGQDAVEGDARKVAKNTLNRPGFWRDHWTLENPNAQYPNPFYADTYDRTSSYWFRSSTTANISNLNISYGLPTYINRALGVNNVRAYVVATNPFELYNPFKDYRVRNGAYNAYPVLKTWSFGINVGF